MAKRYNAAPEVEAAIREDERFRMSLFTADVCRALEAVPIDAETKQILKDVLIGHSMDMLVQGEKFSASMDGFTDTQHEAMEQQKQLATSIAKLATGAARPVAHADSPVQLELFDPADRGVEFEIKVGDDEPEDSGNDNDSGNYLN